MIPPPSLFIEIGLRSSGDSTPADDSQTISPKLVEAFAENYWKWKGGDPVCGRENMKAHWFLMRSLCLLRLSASWGAAFRRSPSNRRIQAMIDYL